MKHLYPHKQEWIMIGLVCLFLIAIPVMVWAQPGLPSDPKQTPIGGGLGILAAVGGSYAVKKLRDKNKE